MFFVYPIIQSFKAEFVWNAGIAVGLFSGFRVSGLGLGFRVEGFGFQVL